MSIDAEAPEQIKSLVLTVCCILIKMRKIEKKKPTCKKFKNNQTILR